MNPLAKLRRQLEHARRTGEPPDTEGLLALLDAADDTVTASLHQNEVFNRHIDRFINALIDLACLRFRNELELTGEDDRLDAFAIGINALSEELQLSTVSRDFVRTIMDSMPDSLMVIDRAGTVELANAATSRLTGRPLDELRGLHIAELCGFSPDEVEAMLAGLELGKTHEELTEYREHDGTPIPILVSLRHLEHDDQDQSRYVWLGKDLTARLQLEDDLRKARDVAIASSVARSNFLANMSHEIRTPMNAVIGMTGLLLETELSHQQRGFTEIVRSSGETLLTLINDILDFSKIESGNLQIETTPTSIHECVQSALDVTTVLASEKGLALTSWVEPDVPIALFSDPTRLQQILVNLLGNAVKFTAAGSISVNVSVRERSGDDYTIEFAVRDTGIGIRPETMNSLFEAFTQAEASTTRRFGGTGLGLAICRRLTAALGGSIEVESEYGSGSTFRFTIQGTAAPHVRPQYLDYDERALAGRRVLVLDANETTRGNIRHWLESWGIRVFTGATPRVILDLLTASAKPFDCAILDRTLGETKVDSLAAAIHEHPAGAELPLLVLTPLNKNERAPYESLYQAFLTKPLRPAYLFDTLHAILTRTEGDPKDPVSRRSDSIDVDMLPKHVRILLAEDNSNNQLVAKLSLGRLGYRADVVADGYEAVRAVQMTSYDIILMDVHMPRLDGLAAARRIRDDPALLDQPYIVAVTASATIQDRDVCMAAGMDDFMSKPYRIQDLRWVLEHYERSRRKTYPDLLAVPDEPQPAPTEPPGPPGPPSTPTSTPASTPASTPSLALDTEMLEELKLMLGCDEPDELGAFVDEFLPGLEELVGQLETALSDGDAPAVKLAAHSLKSNAGTLGAQALQALAWTFERSGSAKDLAAAPPLSTLRAVHQDFLDALAAVRTRDQW